MNFLNNNFKNYNKNTMIKPAIFLDRDGVINFDLGYIYKIDEFKLRPGVIKGLQLLTKKNYRIFIVTNQSGIARGYFKIKDLMLLNKQILKKFKRLNINITKISFSPYHPNGIIKKFKKNSATRKPGNKMIKDILRKWPTDIKKSFMIGDRKSDEQCAKKSNLYFEYAKQNFYNQIQNILKKK